MKGKYFPFQKYILNVCSCCLYLYENLLARKIWKEEYFKNKQTKKLLENIFNIL